MTVYLVLNIENDPFVIDICRTLDAAEKLASSYKANFYESGRDSDDFIEVKKLNLDSVVDVFWTAYPEDKEPEITYGGD